MNIAKRCIAVTIRTLAVAATAGLLATAASAESPYPNRSITLVVPFAAGGPSDVIARLIGQSMSRTLGQQIVIESTIGAGGTAAATRVSRATPDGYTLLIHHLALVSAPSLYGNLSYDTRTAFEPIGLVNTGPMVLVGRKTLQADSAAEFIAYMKKEGDRITMAHAGIGSNGHLCAILMSKAIGSKPVYVPYNGTGPAMNDVIGGQDDVLCDQTTNAVPQILGNSVKAYIVTSPERLDVLKDVATAREAGLPSLEMSIWHGLYAPKGTPPEAIDKLNKALAVALRDPFVVKRFNDVGTTLFPETEWSPQAHKKLFLSEIDRWSALLKEAGVTPANAH